MWHVKITACPGAQVENVSQVALEAGNNPQIIFSNYRELVKPADAVKWFAIEPEMPANVISAQWQILRKEFHPMSETYARQLRCVISQPSHPEGGDTPRLTSTSPTDLV